MADDMPTEDQVASCVNCGRVIIWHFDANDEGLPDPSYGFWYDRERGTEVCGGPDPTVTPEQDIWHEPAS